MEATKTQRSYSIPQKTIDWLLSSQTPSIRYLTYKNILHQPEGDAVVLETRDQIAATKPVQSIFARQDEGGFWSSDRHYYSPKYRSSHWTMLLLTELEVPSDNPSLQKGADFMLKAVEKEIPDYERRYATGFCCFWGNWLRYQLYCGRFEDTRVQTAIDFICKDIELSGTCRYNGDLPCAWAVIRELNGLALIPKNKRSAEVKNAITRGTAFMLDEHDLVQADYPAAGGVHPLWYSLSYPLFYHTDILFTLRVLKELDMLSHPSALSALNWLWKKQTENSLWTGKSPFKDKTRPFLAEPDTIDHWITLLAASIFS